MKLLPSRNDTYYRQLSRPGRGVPAPGRLCSPGRGAGLGEGQCPVPCAMDRLLEAAVKTWVCWCHKSPASPGTHPCVSESSAEQGAVSAPAQSGQWRESTDVPPLASPQVCNLS